MILLVLIPVGFFLFWHSFWLGMTFLSGENSLANESVAISAALLLELGRGFGLISYHVKQATNTQLKVFKDTFVYSPLRVLCLTLFIVLSYHSIYNNIFEHAFLAFTGATFLHLLIEVWYKIFGTYWGKQNALSQDKSLHHQNPVAGGGSQIEKAPTFITAAQNGHQDFLEETKHPEWTRIPETQKEKNRIKKFIHRQKHQIHRQKQIEEEAL